MKEFVVNSREYRAALNRVREIKEVDATFANLRSITPHLTDSQVWGLLRRKSPNWCVALPPTYISGVLWEMNLDSYRRKVYITAIRGRPNLPCEYVREANEYVRQSHDVSVPSVFGDSIRITLIDPALPTHRHHVATVGLECSFSDLWNNNSVPLNGLIDECESYIATEPLLIEEVEAAFPPAIILCFCAHCGGRILNNQCFGCKATFSRGDTWKPNIIFGSPAPLPMGVAIQLENDGYYFHYRPGSVQDRFSRAWNQARKARWPTTNGTLYHETDNGTAFFPFSGDTTQLFRSLKERATKAGVHLGGYGDGGTFSGKGFAGTFEYIPAQSTPSFLSTSYETSGGGPEPVFRGGPKRERVPPVTIPPHFRITITQKPFLAPWSMVWEEVRKLLSTND